MDNLTYENVYNQNPGPIQSQAIRVARSLLDILGNTADATEALKRAAAFVAEWGPNQPHPHS